MDITNFVAGVIGIMVGMAIWDIGKAIFMKKRRRQ